MKKILFTLLLMLTCQMAFCQSASSVFNDFREKKHAEYVSVPKLMLSVAAAKVKDGNVSALLKEVDDVKILTLNDCSKSVRKKFVKSITELSSKGYNEFTGVQKSGKTEGMTILSKESGGIIKEIVAFTSSDSSCIGILITGNINSEDVAAIIGMVND